MNPSQAALHQSFSAIFRRYKVSPLDFANKVRKLKGGKQFTLKGRFCYLREFYLEMFNPKNATVIACLFSRGGKTETVSTRIGHKMLARPNDILIGRPTDRSVKTYSNTDFQKRLVDVTPELSAILPNGQGRRIATNTIYEKSYPGGVISFVTMNSGAGLRTAKGELVYVDEADSVSNEVGDEGDKVDNTIGRADEYPAPTRIVTSYPLYEGESKIWEMLEGSDFRKWHVGGNCGHKFVMHRKQIDWIKGKPQTAVMLCPECGKSHTDEDRVRMILTAEDDGLGWEATREFVDTVGFQSGYMLWPHRHFDAYDNYFHQRAAEMEKIERSRNPEKKRMTLINRGDAEPYQPEAMEKPEPSLLVDRLEHYSIVNIPKEIICIVFGADVQDNRIELEFVGSDQHGSEWGLGYHVLPGKPLDGKIWENLDKLVMGVRFNHPILGKMGIDGGFIDSLRHPDMVRAWTAKRRAKRIFAITGSNQLGKPIIATKKKEKVRAGRVNRIVTVYEIGTHEAKDQIYQNLEHEPEGESFPPGYMHYTSLLTSDFLTIQGYGEEYFKQLTAETPRMKRAKDGDFYKFFECPEGARNEPLDIRVYAKAARIECKAPIGARLRKIGQKTVSKGDESEGISDKSRKNRENWRTGATSLTTGVTTH